MINQFFINTLFLIIIDVLGIWLAVWVYYAKKKDKINRGFSLMVIFILCWITFYHFASFTTQYNKSLLLFRLSGSFVFLFFIAYYFFIKWFLDKTGIYYDWLGKIIFVYGLIFCLFTFFSGFIIPFFQSETWGSWPIFSKIGWFIFYGYVIFLTILINILLIREYFKSSKAKKLKIQYFLAGLLIFAGLNFIFNVILQVFWKNYKFYQLGNYSAIFLLLFTAYAIVKRELFGIKTALTVFFIILTAILLFIDTFAFTTNTLLQIIKIFILSGFLWLSYLLLKSVQKEIKTANKLEIANKNLKELLEARSTFLSVASHQLRTPVSIIRGMLSMVIEGDLSEKKKKTFIERSLYNTERLGNIIRDLLSAGAVETKNFKLNKKPIQIDDLIAKVINERIIKAKEKNLELIYQKPKTPTPPMSVDENKITEIIANLVDNAIQYTTRGKVEITTRIKGKYFIFAIQDTGIGIPKEDKPKLFKKVSRLQNAIAVRPDGTGLGLYLVKKIVEGHGGKVDVKSEGVPGKGSIFTVKLPIK